MDYCNNADYTENIYFKCSIIDMVKKVEDRLKVICEKLTWVK